MVSRLYILLDKHLPNLFNTAVSFSIVAVCCLLFYYFLSKEADSNKSRKIIKKRILYIMLMIDIFILAKIWVEGFSHIFTMLSLVAAGIVITNKESIMNLVGFLIINWRALFAEGDFVQIQSFAGYVSTIGFMYFKIYETTSIDQRQATGRTIKVPNSLVITSPVINFSPESNLYRYTIVCNVQKELTLEEQIQKAETVLDKILDDVYAENTHYNKAYLKSHNRELASLIELHPNIELLPPSDKHEDLRFSVQFYCFSRDYYRISQQFWLKMYSLTTSSGTV